MAASLSTRLETTARALAQLYASGQLTLEQLRAQMARAIAEAHTVALLAGTNGQRNQEIDTALREIIADEQRELDRLISLIEREPNLDLERRLLAFAHTLDETYREGDRLSRQSDFSPLIPIAIGTGALATLLNSIRRTNTGGISGRAATLPRIDSRQLQSVTDALGQRLDALAEQLASGQLTSDQWHEAMQRELDIIHQTYARLGGGSVNDQRLQAQREFLDGFRGDVEGMTPEAIKRRARMYLLSGQVTLQRAATERLGMPFLPGYPKDFTTECGYACQCFWDIFTLDGTGNWDCYWRLRPADHCIHCPRRAEVWSPIEIRNGIIQPYQTAGVFA